MSQVEGSSSCSCNKGEKAESKNTADVVEAQEKRARKIFGLDMDENFFSGDHYPICLTKSWGKVAISKEKYRKLHTLENGDLLAFGHRKNQELFADLYPLSSLRQASGEVEPKSVNLNFKRIKKELVNFSLFKNIFFVKENKNEVFLVIVGADGKITFNKGSLEMIKEIPEIVFQEYDSLKYFKREIRQSSQENRLEFKMEERKCWRIQAVNDNGKVLNSLLFHGEEWMDLLTEA